uniref:Uncharacterized protein n=1 Tax=Anopheles merus TaxID=30066 RepID=A0A182VBF4_ANOME
MGRAQASDATSAIDTGKIAIDACGGPSPEKKRQLQCSLYRAHVLRHQRVVRPLGVGGVQAEKVGREQMLVVRPQLVLLLQAADDELVKLRAELVRVRVGRLGQPGRIVLHHLLELLERRPPGRVREAAGRDLHHRDAERPDVRLDVVAGGPAAGTRIDPLRRHHVRRLHVPVDDAQLGVQVVQGAHDRERYLAQDVLRDGAPGALVHHRNWTVWRQSLARIDTSRSISRRFCSCDWTPPPGPPPAPIPLVTVMRLTAITVPDGWCSIFSTMPYAPRPRSASLRRWSASTTNDRSPTVSVPRLSRLRGVAPSALSGTVLPPPPAPRSPSSFSLMPGGLFFRGIVCLSLCLKTSFH